MCRIRRHTDIPELHVINLFPQQLDEPPNQHHLIVIALMMPTLMSWLLRLNKKNAKGFFQTLDYNTIRTFHLEIKSLLSE